MPKRIDRSYGCTLIKEAAQETLKNMFNTGILLFEAAAILLVFLKSESWKMFPFGIAMIVITLFGCVAVKLIEADMRLYLLGTLLVNFGFMSQFFSGNDIKETWLRLLFKLCVAFVAFLFSGFLMYFGERLLMKMEYHLVFQAGLYAAMVLMALIRKKADNVSFQDALVNLDLGLITIQPFEIIKVSYLFVLAHMVCISRESRLEIFGKELPKKAEVCAVVLYTAAIMLAMGVCGELGSAFLILGACAVMMTIFHPDRKTVLLLWLAVLILIAAGSTVVIRRGGEIVENIKKIEEDFKNTGQLEALNLSRLDKVFLKIYYRFATCFHPEEWAKKVNCLDDYVPGGHGISINEAITAGGWLGPSSRRYITAFGEQTNDMVFTKFVQCMGIPFGIILTGLYGWFLSCIADIGRQEKDVYWKAVCAGILALIGIEAVYNIGCASGLLPIMGIPLYLISQGFTSLSMGFFMLAVLLVISARSSKRSSLLNEIIEAKAERNRSKSGKAVRVR